MLLVCVHVGSGLSLILGADRQFGNVLLSFCSLTWLTADNLRAGSAMRNEFAVPAEKFAQTTNEFAVSVR
jgi:hypothetical protein